MRCLCFVVIAASLAAQDRQPAQSGAGGQTDNATNARVAQLFARTLALPSLRFRMRFDWVATVPNTDPDKSWVEGVYEGGLYCWYFPSDRGAKNASAVRKRVLELETELSRRPRHGTPAEVAAKKAAEQAAELATLRAKLRDACGASVVATAGARWLRRHDDGWIECRKPDDFSYLPDARFLIERLVAELPKSKWTRKLGETIDERPVRAYRVVLDAAASERMVASGALTDVGLRGSRAEGRLSVRGPGWSTTSSARGIDTRFEVIVLEDPPTHLPLALRVNIRSPTILRMLGNFRRFRGKNVEPRDENEDPEKVIVARIEFDLVRPGVARATEVGENARKLLGR